MLVSAQDLTSDATRRRAGPLWRLLESS